MNTFFQKKNTTTTAKDAKDPIRLEGPTESLHGHLGKRTWAAPLLVLESHALARPGYDNTTASHEYLEDAETLREKVKLLAQLIRRSKQFMAYTGAGISTASGIGDYATHSDKSLSSDKQPKLRSPLEARPTLSHRVLVSLQRHGFLKHWIQQNHDGMQCIACVWSYDRD